MKTKVLAAAATMIAATVSMGKVYAQNDSPPQSQSNMACVEKLELPLYSLLAKHARIEGVVTASVVLSPESTVQGINSQAVSMPNGAKALLMEPVEKAIRGASFRSDCHRKTVTMVFDFRIVGEPSDYPKQSVAFGYPNRFWIVSEPPKVQTYTVR